MRKEVVCLVCFLMTLALTASPAAAETVAYYPLDEGSGDTTIDASGNGRDGRINGSPEWIDGKFGKALEFSGASGGHVDLGTWNPSEGTDLLSFGLWVKWNGLSGEWQGLISKRNAWDPAPIGEMMWFLEANNATGTLWFGRRDGGGVGGTNETLPEGQWQHIAVTCDGSTATMYRDGAEVNSGGFTLGSKTDAGLQIGSGYVGGVGPFNGAVDDVRIYNHALSAEEIQDAMMGAMPQAYGPKPADGSVHEDTWATLSWTPGTSAVSHDVYFGDNFADVDAGTPGAPGFQGNQTSTFFVVGFPGFPYPDGLVPGTTYYWRIDEVEADGTIHKGDVWSFSVPSQKAYNPQPADTARFIDPAVRLRWDAGFRSKVHNVYFGDNFADVEAGTGGTARGPVGDTIYSPGTLELDKTYYWRIDEFDGLATHKGDVWSFTTTHEGGGIRADYYKGMNFETFALTRTDAQINFNWPDQSGPDPAVGHDNFSVRWTGEVEAVFTETYTFYPRTDDGVRLWVDGVLLVDNWLDRAATEDKGTIDLVAGNTYSLVMEYYDNTAGAVAELRWSSPRTPKAIIPQAALSLPVKASSPNPRSGSVDVTQHPVLTWGAGQNAASHEVYFGTDEDTVRNATSASPEFKGTKALGSESYDPGQLAWGVTYYWRVDEINTQNADSPWTGNVWSFTTADFLVVDDFEGYTDNDAANEAIWQNWTDGFGVPENGSQVGYVLPAYAEQTIVHGGSQSMPLFYDNTAGVKFSEAELKLTNVRDWTEEGVGELSIWFAGLPGSVGSFTEAPAGTFTMTASGTDIWDVGTAGDYRDEFHFAYKTLTGAGTIMARVTSVQNTDGWAKAGVMIRETLEPGSKHAFACITPTNGVASQGRVETGGASFNTAQSGITAPYWVKLERSISGNFTVSHSANGTTWVPVTNSNPANIQMGSTVYVGLAVTSHNAAATCQAVFSNVTITGTAGAQWANQDIGIESNAAEPLYVAVSNASGTPAVVYHDNPNAAQIDTWTLWNIPLQEFADQGINLTNVDKLAVGLGSQGNPGAPGPGGSGKMFFDDIRLVRPVGQ
ncbi:MAG: LamG-like jellyroll fold domain-containing protein [Planctomycetota bacterium]